MSLHLKWNRLKSKLEYRLDQQIVDKMEIKANSNNKYSKSVKNFSKQDTNIKEKSEDVLNRQEWILSDFTIFNIIRIR